MDLPERLAEEVEHARALLHPEEREALADTLMARIDPRQGPLQPRAADVANRISTLLDQLESIGCDRADWLRMVAGDLTEPDVVKPPAKMSDDELEREMERRAKYGPSS